MMQLDDETWETTDELQIQILWIRYTTKCLFGLFNTRFLEVNYVFVAYSPRQGTSNHASIYIYIYIYIRDCDDLQDFLYNKILLS